MSIFSNPNIDVKFKELTELYLVVKETILYFEEINQEQKADIQVINELRNAFDHLMRVTATIFDVKRLSNEPNEYILKNLDKAYGHVYRAGYDTVDFLCLTIKKEISESLSRFDPSVIKEALPDYYPTIKPRLVKLENDIANYRSKKDVTEDDHERLIDYINVSRELGDFREKISLATDSLIEIQQEANNATLKNWFAKVIIGLFLLFLGAILNHFWLYNKSSNKTKYSRQSRA